MATRRQTRKRRKSAWSTVIIVLVAAVIMCVLVICIMRLDLTRPVEYPVEYVADIRLAAHENSIPAPYIAAVIMAESSYDPRAVSSVGAMGLMQIMPDTGDWIAGKFGEECADGALFIPEVSIKYGAWYLGFLLERYGGDMRCATAAYHAGQGTVDKWLADPQYSQDGVTLTKIGYDSTSTYVDRVLKYYEYYQEAYEELETE